MAHIPSATRRARSPFARLRSRVAARGPGARGGFSLVEVVVTSVIVVVAIGGFSATIVSSVNLREVGREVSVASLAARDRIEALRTEGFDGLFYLYNDYDADDYWGAGLSPGPGFEVAGLEPRPGDADGLVGRIEFPSVVTGGVEQLREDVVNDAFGLPMDLNCDGVIDTQNHAGDYEVLPVRVVVEWRGVGGNGSVTLTTVLTR